ncbi:MAG: hypothetical protein JRD89_02790 [Deltaproteobacteria bacterium]|nr:hypothetical protein [Deltaproteobacteria bacterium]
MMTFALNRDTGDIQLDGAGNIVTVTGGEEKTQSVWLLLSMMKEEWFLNPDYGLDYWAFLGQKWSAAREQTYAAFIDTLQQEPRIREIHYVNLSYDENTRTLTVEFKVTMDGEEIEESMEITV